MIKISASAVHRIKKCAHSAFLESSMPREWQYRDGYKQQAERGTAIHAAAEDVLNAAITGLSGAKITALIKKVCKTKLKEYAFDDCFYTSKTYVSYVLKTHKQADKNWIDTDIAVEEKHRKTILGCDMVAKLDASIFCFANFGFYIHIFDLKTGYIDYEATAYDQLRFTALLLSLLFPKNMDFKGFTIHTVQPLYYDATKQIITHTEQITTKQARKELAELAEFVKTGKCAMGSHCRFCPCVLGCKSVNDLVDFINSNEVENMDMSRLEYVYDSRDAIDAFMRACEGKLIEFADRGESGKYEVREKSGHKKWKDEKAVEKSLRIFGDGIYGKRKLLSPAKMEKFTSDDLSALYETPKVKILVKKENVFEVLDFHPIATDQR